ncbi:BQ5605_C008g04979 [Microbotryum silenes-dioicae]|uniref:BQ5605_C008g04979 protein n=1 Tax=Microbotryum silenes-dioicae TaxID=796604 RepID=A0A2X0PDI1_9BASI|nr:BQ5605_C008g04979 [Microbotryum silenes-dioicae]
MPLIIDDARSLRPGKGITGTAWATVLAVSDRAQRALATRTSLGAKSARGTTGRHKALLLVGCTGAACLSYDRRINPVSLSEAR